LKVYSHYGRAGVTRVLESCIKKRLVEARLAYSTSGRRLQCVNVLNPQMNIMDGIVRFQVELACF